jgi:hypothetical protein
MWGTGFERFQLWAYKFELVSDNVDGVTQNLILYSTEWSSDTFRDSFGRCEQLVVYFLIIATLKSGAVSLLDGETVCAKQIKRL